MNGNEPATKADLAAVEERLDGKILQLRMDNGQLRSEMNHHYNDLVERISDSETKLLKAFYSFADANQRRLVEIEGNEAALRTRVGSLETRLLEVEKRLNIPPAA